MEEIRKLQEVATANPLHGIINKSTILNAARNKLK